MNLRTGKIAGACCAAVLILGSCLTTAFAQNQQDRDWLISQGPGAVNIEALRETSQGGTDQAANQSGADQTAAQGGTEQTAVQSGTDQASGKESFDVNQFVLPQEAAVLVVVEGTTGSDCNLYVYEKMDGNWVRQMETSGYFGKNGISNNRIAGDKTTPIGVFQMNTPFGQSAPLPGFPSNYIQVDGSYVWEDTGNKLSQDPSKTGEKVGSSGYKGYYDYVIDFGYNPNGVPYKGSALFLHCEGDYKGDTSGCVAIKKDEMAKVMLLYGKYGDGRCFSALAPAGTFHLIYNSYGTNNGLSPEGDFHPAK